MMQCGPMPWDKRKARQMPGLSFQFRANFRSALLTTLTGLLVALLTTLLTTLVLLAALLLLVLIAGVWIVHGRLLLVDLMRVNRPSRRSFPRRSFSCRPQFVRSRV